MGVFLFFRASTAIPITKQATKLVLACMAKAILALGGGRPGHRSDSARRLGLFYPVLNILKLISSSSCSNECSFSNFAFMDAKNRLILMMAGTRER